MPGLVLKRRLPDRPEVGDALLQRSARTPTVLGVLAIGGMSYRSVRMISSAGVFRRMSGIGAGKRAYRAANSSARAAPASRGEPAAALTGANQ